MSATDHRTGTVQSGDVSLFYRHFGSGGGTPMLIYHGANYYDSADWIGVAGALAADREVMVWDTRGFGESGWSPSKNYSLDAQVDDAAAIMDHLGWDKAIIGGHSMGGRHAIVFSSRMPERTEATVIIDHCPGRGGGSLSFEQSVGNEAKVFESAEAALAVMSREPPKDEAGWQRVRDVLKPVDGGFVFRRDPDFANPIPVGIDGWTSRYDITDVWFELARIVAPTLIVRGTLSDRYGEEEIARVHNDFPDIAWSEVAAGHDVAGAAPEALVDSIKRFLAERVDSGGSA
jgi:pimeloyl-ACP methyl ester carboxylesterase